MKIITVNLPVGDIRTIKSLVGDNGLYPSRSELIRVAVREFLIKEIKTAKSIPKYKEKYEEEEEEEEEIDTKDTVRIPMGIGNDNSTKEYKTYRIIHR